jgi:hypothetical protein
MMDKHELWNRAYAKLRNDVKNTYSSGYEGLTSPYIPHMWTIRVFRRQSRT